MVEEKKSTKSVYDRIYQAVWLVVAALVGISTAYYKDIFGLTGVLLAWAIVIIVFLTIEVIRLSIKNQKLEEDDANKKKIDDLFLTKLMDPYVECGQDFVVPKDEAVTFTFPVTPDERLEILAFSRKKFDIVIVDEDNADKLDNVMRMEGVRTFTNGLLNKNKIHNMAFSDEVTYVKLRYNIKDIDKKILWKIYIQKTDHTDEHEIVVNFLISYLPSMQSQIQTKLEVK